ncbi:MAG: S41 family peptidase [Cyanobacteriota bacterium]|nr:S41 family peptidase [Cyanobacteriota bacterium]
MKGRARDSFWSPRSGTGSPLWSSLKQVGVWVLIGWLSLHLLVCQAQAASLKWGDEQKLLATAWTLVDRAYVDPTFNGQNWWSVRQKALAQPLPDREATYHAIEGMLTSLGDPFTRFLDRQHYQSLQTSTAGELNGVGLQIAIDEAGRVMVISPIEGSPADQAGILTGDQIVAIDQQPTAGMSLDAVAEKMRGASGTGVDLWLQRGERQMSVRLLRAAISIHPVRSKWVAGRRAGETVAYIRLNQFNGNAAQEVKQAIVAAEAQPVAGYILDLRNNPGGLLQAAIEIAQMWIGEGDIVLVTDRNGIQDSIRANSSVLTTAPLVVLVNQGSASASEVLAGALQDAKRAVLVGTQTFGKGLIQSLFDLPDGSGLAITTAKYMTPQGRDINKLGIHPDFVVELPQQPLSYEQVASEQDPQFMAALHFLRDASADFGLALSRS